MDVARLAWALIRHILRGRGRDTVILSIDLPPEISDRLAGVEWHLCDMTWAVDGSRYTLLRARRKPVPDSPHQPGPGLP